MSKKKEAKILNALTIQGTPKKKKYYMMHIRIQNQKYMNKFLFRNYTLPLLTFSPHESDTTQSNYPIQSNSICNNYQMWNASSKL